MALENNDALNVRGEVGVRLIDADVLEKQLEEAINRRNEVTGGVQRVC